MPDFHQDPILNSPYAIPDRHWELADGLPTGRVIDSRRACSYLTPIPRSKHRRKDTAQGDLFADQPKVAVDGVEYDPTSIVNQVRSQVDSWRRLPESQWGVTPSTARAPAAPPRSWSRARVPRHRLFTCPPVCPDAIGGDRIPSSRWPDAVPTPGFDDAGGAAAARAVPCRFPILSA